MADFGSVLKEWRQTRRVSQIDPALSAGVSARHVSFLETGRARPSRGMVLRLCENLQIPNAGRNRMLIAAGLAPTYEMRAADDADLEALAQAVTWMLERHAPYPGMALDRHWRLVELNRPARLILSATGLDIGDSLIEALLNNEALRSALVNLQEVERHTLSRLRTELSHFGHDPVLEHVVATLEKRVNPEVGEVVLPAVIPASYQTGDMVMSFFSTISQFGTTGDLTMSELKVELMFPADDVTRTALMALSGG